MSSLHFVSTIALANVETGIGGLKKFPSYANILDDLDEPIDNRALFLLPEV
jgi:hypothetical protein